MTDDGHHVMRNAIQ